MPHACDFMGALTLLRATLEPSPVRICPACPALNSLEDVTPGFFSNAPSTEVAPVEPPSTLSFVQYERTPATLPIPIPDMLGSPPIAPMPGMDGILALDVPATAAKIANRMIEVGRGMKLTFRHAG